VEALEVLAIEVGSSGDNFGFGLIIQLVTNAA
jgi:hypothetical protein